MLMAPKLYMIHFDDKKKSNTQCHSDNVEIFPNGQNIRQKENEIFTLPSSLTQSFPVGRKNNSKLWQRFLLVWYEA